MPHLQPSISQKEHDPNRSAKRVVQVDPFGGAITDGNFTTKIDSVDVNTTYIGIAQIGTPTSDPSWQIKKISTVSTISTIAWADGTDAFSKVWDDRTSFSYS